VNSHPIAQSRVLFCTLSSVRPTSNSSRRKNFPNLSSTTVITDLLSSQTCRRQALRQCLRSPGCNVRPGQRPLPVQVARSMAQSMLRPCSLHTTCNLQWRRPPPRTSLRHKTIYSLIHRRKPHLSLFHWFAKHDELML
jgi:hypothetical protein